MQKKSKRPLFILFLLTLIGGFLHFYNLNWGAPFYFHPDERNIASAVSQLHFQNQMNPHFFAYGALPIYAIYFTTVVANYISQWLQISTQSQPFTATFEQAILVGRTFSALFATLLIPTLYLIGKKFKDEKTGLWSAFFATTSVGFIQFAHFGTFEMWLTFFGVLLFWLSLNYLYKQNTPKLIFMALVFGILVAIKVTSLALLPIPLALVLAKQFKFYKSESGSKNHESWKTKILIHNSLFIILLRTIKDIVLFLIISLLVYCLTNPYVFLDQKDFFSSMNYESSVALGTLPVFYTDIFYNTTPVVYQVLHVFPFLLNPLMIILFILAFVYLFWQMIKTKSQSYAILYTFFLILLLSQAFLFVKWTRYMVPTLPFIYLIIAIAISSLRSLTTKISSIKYLVLSMLIVVSIIFAFAYFKTAFIDPDSRIDALSFAQHAIPVDATILSEPADLGVVPFQDAFPHLNTFNFYDLDNNSTDATETQLQQDLSTAQYIILPSPRILQSRIEDPTRFPKGYVFYKSLLDGQLGFHKTYETPCDVFCKITYLGDPVYWWEQTVSVFDRPTVFIFEKNS